MFCDRVCFTGVERKIFMTRILKFLIALLVSAMVMALCASAEVFYDVDESDYFADAAYALHERGVLSGYEDGSFGAENVITRAEMAAIICRAADLKGSAKAHIFTDVPLSHWANNYISEAYLHALIVGDGDGKFRPSDSVKYEESLKIVVRALAPYLNVHDGKEDWSAPYFEASDKLGLGNGLSVKKGKVMTRADVAVLVYNALSAADKPTMLKVGEYTLYIGMPESELKRVAGEPNTLESSIEGFNWAIYNTKTYENFFMAGIYKGEVVALCSSGKGVEYGNYKAGDKNVVLDSTSDTMVTAYCDINDENRLHCVYLLKKGYVANHTYNSSTLSGESKANFHLVNSFRVLHGQSILAWDENASRAARLHSEDMAYNNYFEHDSLDGRKLPDRLRAVDAKFTRGYGENIFAGAHNSVEAHAGWINSAGHRQNLLYPNYTSLGVGAGYNEESYYKVYSTQDFLIN